MSAKEQHIDIAMLRDLARARGFLEHSYAVERIAAALNSVERVNARASEAAIVGQLVEVLRSANAQMEMAAECIEAGRIDEALLHVRSMSGRRRAALAAAGVKEVGRD